MPTTEYERATVPPRPSETEPAGGSAALLELPVAGEKAGYGIVMEGGQQTLAVFTELSQAMSAAAAAEASLGVVWVVSLRLDRVLAAYLADQKGDRRLI